MPRPGGKRRGEGGVRLSGERVLIRAFLAVEADSELHEALGAAQAKLSDADPEGRVRWVRPGTWHITLHFLGLVEEDLLAPLMQLVGGAARKCPGFDLGLTEVRLFPKPQRPRALIVGVTPSPVLSQLAERVIDACERTGFHRERRTFHPHLTLGRVRRDAPPIPLPSLATLPPLPVREVVLLRSHLGPGGARYERLATAPLGPVAN